MESTKNNFGLEYLKENSTPKSIEVDPKHFKSESVENSFDMESTNESSTTKLLVIDFIEGVRVIMIGCFFIQIDEMTLEGQKRFIHP